MYAANGWSATRESEVPPQDGLGVSSLSHLKRADHRSIPEGGPRLRLVAAKKASRIRARLQLVGTEPRKQC